MDIPRIHVHTFSDKSTISYVTFMWETMLELANRPSCLMLSVHCMGSTAADRLSTLKSTKTYVVPDVQVGHGLEGSVGHGASIEDALSMTDDGDIHILVDSDTVVLAKGWDDYLRIKLLDEGVGTLGATYEDVGSFSSGAGNVQTYKGIPNVVWMAMSPLHRWQDLKAMPKKESNVIIDTDELSQIYGLPKGYQVLRDVGWQIPEYLATHGISRIGWKQLKPNGAAFVLKGLSDYHEEYHVEGGIPFVVHHRGSMRHAYRKDQISQSFFNAVDVYLAQEKDRTPRWRWSYVPAKHGHVQQHIESCKRNAAEKLVHHERRAWKGENKVLTNVPVAEIVDLAGWLKVTLDDVVLRSRHVERVPSVLDIAYTPNANLRTLRLEGDVKNGTVKVRVPGVLHAPHHLIVRNATNSSVMMSTLNGINVVHVPQNACYQLLIDVDGVVKVG